MLVEVLHFSLSVSLSLFPNIPLIFGCNGLIFLVGSLRMDKYNLRIGIVMRINNKEVVI